MGHSRPVTEPWKILNFRLFAALKQASEGAKMLARPNKKLAKIPQNVIRIYLIPKLKTLTKEHSGC